jgi:glycosyltransferase involved in cell wall biosynthesis
MDTPTRLKVLVSAYACSPYEGSEPGVGWGFVRAMAARHELWVIVEEEKFRADIERYLAGDPGLRRSLRFFFIRKRRNRWLRRVWPPSYYWYYRQWQRQALEVARRLHAEVGFDLAHQLTMVGFREPGYLWQLGIPFVWGPIGGMGLFPWRFLGEIGLRGALRYLVYNVFNLAQMRWMTRARSAAAAAGRGLIAATKENRAHALRHWKCRSEVISEVGLPAPPAGSVQGRDPRRPLVIVWSGQHTPGKALNLGLAALAKLPPDVDWTLDVLGRGSETDRWKALALDLGIGTRCRFHGWVERTRALEVMRAGHVQLITSLRDLTSTVTVEALSLGLPVVCPDHCGFADAIDDTCGIKVPVGTVARLVTGIADAIGALARDEARRLALAHGALRRAGAYDWDAKALQLDDIYRAVLRGGPVRKEADERIATP